MSMRVPFMDLRRTHAPLREAILARVAAVVDSERFILGPEVEGFESALADYVGCGAAIGVSSGTDALLAALMALGLGPGDEVVTSAFTFFATAGAVARLGARPVFADIEPASFNLSPARACERLGPRTRAVLPVHLYGRTADVASLRVPCAERGIAIVEDAAQAIGATDADGRRAGALGALGCISFFPTKNLGAMGDAGAVTTSDEELAARVRTIRVHGARPKYHHHVVGGNFRLDAIQAAVLSLKLRGLDEANERRRASAAGYGERLRAAGLVRSGAIVLPEPGAGRHVYHQYVVRAQRRDRLRDWLVGRGVSTMVYYPEPLHLQPCFAELGVRAGDLPETERAAREVVALPVFPGLRPEEQDYVVETIAAFYAA